MMVSGALALLWWAIIVVVICVAAGRRNVSPVLVLLVCGLLYGLCVGLSPDAVLMGVADGFGSWLGSLGLAIVITAITSTVLEKSGDLAAIGRSVAKRMQGEGYKHLSKFVALLGFLVAVPSSTEFGYFLFSPVLDSAADSSGAPKAKLTLAYSVGMYASSVLVVPTVAALACARAFSASLGEAFLVGLGTAIPACACGLWWISHKAPLGPESSRVESPSVTFSSVASEVEKSSSKKPGTKDEGKDQNGLPSAKRSLFPIVLPVLLLILRMIGNLPSRPFGSGAIDGLVEFCGHPVVAALFGLVSAVIILRKSPARGDDDFWAQLTGWIEKAVTKVAPVLLVAALAAALSQVIKAGPLLECIGDAFASNHTSTRFLVLFSCFALAALFKSIQGSSLVAAVLASGVMASFPQTVTLNPALAVAAVGAGALAVSHVNDPFYWILQKGLGWSTREMTRAWTVATAIEGAAGFAAVCIMALFVR